MTAPRLAGFTEAQIRSIREADARLNIWEGAIRSGKTVASLVRWVGHLVEMQGRSGENLVTGATRESIARNVFGPLQDPMLLGPIAAQVNYTAGAPTATVLGEKVHIIGASDAKAEPKVRGVTAKSLYADEITVLPEAFFRQSLGRLSVPGAKAFGSTNPGAPNHWLRRDFLLRSADLDLAVWHFGLEDNTFLDPAYVAAVKAEFTGLWYRRFILGEWVQAEGAIFDMFDHQRHVVNEVPEVSRHLCTGVDYGTSNPFAALTLVETIDRRLCLTREYRHDPRHSLRKLTDADFSLRLAEFLFDVPPHMVAVDPSAASFKEQLRSDKMRRVQDADNSVVDSIRLASSLLATDRLTIHESCEGLINEIPGYSWDDKAAEKGEDKPIKTEDHSIDAGLRYAPYTSRHLWNSEPVSVGRSGRSARMPAVNARNLRR